MVCRVFLNDEFVVVGIVFWVIMGCIGVYFFVYVRIVYYFDWMISNGVFL